MRGTEQAWSTDLESLVRDGGEGEGGGEGGGEGEAGFGKARRCCSSL
jgi:hypothetical protein